MSASSANRELAGTYYYPVSGYVSGPPEHQPVGAGAGKAHGPATHDLRAFGEGRHRAVDDTPAGGGAGMVLRADIASAALTDTQNKAGDLPVLLPSPRGVPFTQEMAADLALGKGAIFMCNRFEASMSGLSKPMICAKFQWVTIFCRAARWPHLPCWTRLFACCRG